MAAAKNNLHRFYPSGDCLVKGEFVARGGTTKFRILETHEYIGPVYRVTIPAGYEFDGATIPRPLWSIFERYGLWVRAALYHDQLYDKRIGTRAAADALFLEIMYLDGVPYWQRMAMYAAVRCWPGNIKYWGELPKKAGAVVQGDDK